MIVLGLDTATHSTVVGLQLADGSALCASDDPAADEHPGHATRLLSMIDGLLERSGVGWRQLERVAVGLGPGRFTGLRVGVTTAKTFAYAVGADVLGISTLETIAHGVPPGLLSGGPREVHAVLDAQRREPEGFEADGELLEDERGERLEVEVREAGRGDERGACEHEQQERAAEKVGHEAADGGWLGVGDGAVRYRAQLEAAGVVVPPERSPLHALDGGAICELGAMASPALRYEELLPDYRRTPDVARSRSTARSEPLAAGAGAPR